MIKWSNEMFIGHLREESLVWLLWTLTNIKCTDKWIKMAVTVPGLWIMFILKRLILSVLYGNNYKPVYWAGSARLDSARLGSSSPISDRHSVGKRWQDSREDGSDADLSSSAQLHTLLNLKVRWLAFPGPRCEPAICSWTPDTLNYLRFP